MAKKIITYILVFILIVLSTASMSYIILYTTILNKNFMLNELQKSNYYSKTYSIILEEFKDNTIQSGLEESIFDGIITEEQVRKDIKEVVTYIYSGQEYSISTEEVKQKLQENIQKVIKENSKQVMKDEQQAINTYVDTIGDIYTNRISLSKQYIGQVQRVFSKIQRRLIKYGFIICITTIIVGTIIIAVKKRKSLKYISIATISTGMLLTIPKIMETAYIDLKDILIVNGEFSKVVINIAETIINTFLIIGILLIMLGIIESVFSIKKKYKTR